MVWDSQGRVRRLFHAIQDPQVSVISPGSGDACDPSERCPGSAGGACPANSVAPANTVCRTGSGDSCDPNEVCSGTPGQACPANVVAPATTVCRAGSGDVCDTSEKCTGVAGQTCPANVVAPSTTQCRAGSGDVCDVGANCTGVAGQVCPSTGVAASTTVCRTGSGDACDPTERCTGVMGQTCPANVISPTSTVCRAGSGDLCDPTESCTGVAGQTCPANVVAPSTTVCRAGSGDLCDPTERCTGTAGATCPANVIAPSTTVCRTGSGDSCDPSEKCTGTAGAVCPANVISSAGTVCRAGSGDPSGSGVVCDPAEACNGVAGTTCPADVRAPASQVCRAGSGDLCDPSESCPGTSAGACPADVFASTTTICRPGGGDPNGTGYECDPPEHCPGMPHATCPANVFAPSTQVCNVGSGNPGGGLVCDPEEHCPGVLGGVCPFDVFESLGTICRPGSGWDPELSVCNASEGCLGIPNAPCPPDLSPVDGGVILRAQQDARVMEAHASSNDGAAGLMWLKRSSDVRGLVGFDVACQAAATPSLECAVLELSIHEGTPSNNGTYFAANRLNVDWVEGNQAFNDFSWNGAQLGTFPGTGSGTTWSCRIDENLADGGTNDCAPQEDWSGGDDCAGGPCYSEPGTEAFYANVLQERLFWEVTPDVLGASAPVSWLLRVADDTVGEGSVKLYQRDGARFMSEHPGSASGADLLDLAPRLVLFGPGVRTPSATLVSPIGGSAVSPAIVSIDLFDGTPGPSARWENQTTGEWGYMGAGGGAHWSASIPLRLGANEIEFTVYDACGTEGTSEYTITHATGAACGDAVLNPGEECDDGNTKDGDCCSATCEIDADDTPCEDGEACSTGDRCAGGSCVGGVTQPLGCENDYLCYQTNTSKNAPLFAPVPDAALSDLGGDATFALQRPGLFCVPGGVESAAIGWPEASMVSYGASERSRRAVPSQLRVADRFGTRMVALSRAKTIQTPARWALDDPAPAPEGNLEDHYICYSANTVQKWPKGVQAEVDDAFEDRHYNLIKPSRLCLAAGFGGEPSTNPDAQLMCYQVKAAKGSPSHQRVVDRIHTHDVFGELKLDTKGEKELCVRATVELP